ncbi:MAG: hypothetical protein JNL70_12095 [Saprospiraceae bacterium]|nr:hypothetical protein [Saprospiraceae bacterium]
MKKYINIAFAFSILSLTWVSCFKEDLPVDEDGLLITTRAECAVTNFELLGSDFVTVRTVAAVIDTVAQKVAVTVQFGTDLKNVYPQFTLSQDAKLDPKITGKMDFSDLANPKVFTVVSGNRQVRKPYTVNITVQPK